MTEERNIIFIGPKDPISFTYYHRQGFLMKDVRFYSLEHWFTFCRAKCFGEESIAGQLSFTKDRGILQSLKNKLEKLTKNSTDSEKAKFWSRNRADFMNEAIVELIKSSKDVQNFLKEHRDDIYAVNTPNTFWGIGYSKIDVKKMQDEGKSSKEIYESAVHPSGENAKIAKNKMGTLWMDVRDAWFEQGLDKKEIEKVIKEETPTKTPSSVIVNKFSFLKIMEEEEDQGKTEDSVEDE